MNGIFESLKSVVAAISNILSPFVNIGLLLVVGLLALIAWLAEPGKGLRKFNVPILTWAAIVVAVFVGLQSLTFLTTLGMTLSDRLIITQITIIIALFVLMGHYRGAAAKIVLWILVVLVVVAVVVTGLAGPPTSLMSNFVRTVQSAVNQIFGSLGHS